MNRRLYLIILIGILLLSVIGGTLYWAVKKQNNNSNQPARLGIKKVSDTLPISPVPTFDGSAIWYFDHNAKLYRIKSDGSELTEYPLPLLEAGFSSALWPKTGNDFLVVTKTGSKAFYKSTSSSFINLAQNVQSIDWMPDGKRAVYVWKSSDNLRQTLVLADADGTGFRTISDLFWPDLMLKASPDGKKVLMFRGIIQGDINKIYITDLETGAISTIVDQGKNTGAVWVSADKFIYTQVQDLSYPRLYLKDITKDISMDLKINTTLDKIVLDKDAKYMYGAVANSTNTKDSFIKLDLSTLTEETYLEATEEVRGTNLMLLGSTLFFVNSRDGKLYSITK